MGRFNRKRAAMSEEEAYVKYNREEFQEMHDRPRLYER